MIVNTYLPRGRVPKLLGKIDVSEMYKSSDADSKIIVADGSLPGHRLLLSSVSPLLRHCLDNSEGSQQEHTVIIAPDFKLVDLERLLLLLYGLENEVDENIDELLSLWECFFKLKSIQDDKVPKEDVEMSDVGRAIKVEVLSKYIQEESGHCIENLEMPMDDDFKLFDQSYKPGEWSGGSDQMFNDIVTPNDDYLEKTEHSYDYPEEEFDTDEDYEPQPKKKRKKEDVYICQRPDGKYSCKFSGCKYVGKTRELAIRHFKRSDDHLYRTKEPIKSEEGIFQCAVPSCTFSSEDRKEVAGHMNKCKTHILKHVRNAKQHSLPDGLKKVENDSRYMVGADNLFHCAFPCCNYATKNRDHFRGHFTRTTTHAKIKKRFEIPNCGGNGERRADGSFLCPVQNCSSTLTQYPDLKQHVKDHISEDGKAIKFQCTYDDCYEVRRTYGLLKCHIASHFNGGIEQKPPMLEDMIQKVKGRKFCFECFLPNCEFVANKIDELKAHIDGASEHKTIREKLDTQGFDDLVQDHFMELFTPYWPEEDLTDHNQMVGENLLNIDQTKNKESIISKTDKDRENMNEGIEQPMMEKSMRCTSSKVSLKVLKKKNQASKCVDNSLHWRLRKVLCTDCGIIVPNYQLKRHKESAHGISMDRTDSMEIVCKECGKKVVGKIMYQKHMDEEHMFERKKSIRRLARPGFELINFIPHPDDPLKCPEPTCSYSHPNRLTRVEGHWKSKHVFQFCPYCNKKLLWASMERHVAINHEPERLKFMCNECDAKFFDITALRNHRECYHEKDPKYMCQICGMSFVAMVLLHKHKQRKHKNTGERFRCPGCSDRVYKNQRKFKEHLKKFHPDEFEKIYPKKGSIIDNSCLVK